MDTFRIAPTKLGIILFALGLNPKDLYEPLGLTPQYFHQLLWGQRYSEKAFIRIAEHLKIPLEEIV